jgi:Cu+-exporting ATPase
VEGFQTHPGGGVSARLNDQEVFVGNRRFLESQNVELTQAVDNAMSQLDAVGQTCILVARAGEVLGAIGTQDTIRPEASGVLEELRQSGVNRITLITGDRLAAARLIAEQLEINEVQAELLPAQKAELIERMKAAGQNVAMVGDGINDAPALARADVGLALGGVGSDIAAEAGDVVLMGDPLRPLPLLLRLSRKTVEIIRQNILWFAFGVNAIGVGLIAWLLPAWSDRLREQSPIWAAVYHQIGSLAVLLNAMRLLWFERGVASDRWKAFSYSVDRWIERLSFHDFLHWFEVHWRRALLVTGIIVAGLYLLTSVAIIGPDEIGIVQRFGRPLPDDLEPGLHVRWPWLCERVTRVQPERLRSVDVGFRTTGQARRGLDDLTWAATHGDGILREREESLMITGDSSLIEVQASVFYHIDNPRRFLFEVKRPEDTLRAVTEAVLREVIAEQPFLAILTTKREAFHHIATERLAERLRSPAYDLGIGLHSLTFQDLHPPQEVVDAYYDVARALSQKDQQVTKALQTKEQAIFEEESGRLRQRAQAFGQHHAVTRLAQAERDAFLALAMGPKVARLRGFVLPVPGSPGSLAGLPLLAGDEDGVVQWLTEFRLHVETAELILAGRPKVLHDPAFKGRLHIMPELLKLRLPPLGREREMPARSEKDER